MTTRTYHVHLTEAELEAALWAMGQMTWGNCRDIDEMVQCGMSRAEARHLIKAEAKMLLAKMTVQT